MEREDIVALLDVQRKTFIDIIKADRDENKKNITEVVKSLEFSQAEIEDLKSKMETDRRERIALEKKLQLLTEENNHLKKKVEELEDRTDSLDDQHRQINLRFSGIQEAEGENWEQSQQKLGRILQEAQHQPIFRTRILSWKTVSPEV